MVMLMNEKHKTKICNNWLTNTCKYGENCTFAHGENDLKVPKIIKKEVPSNYKTMLCKNWTTNNLCLYGDKCVFAHGKDDLKTIEKKPSICKIPENYKTKDCKNWKDGHCPYGDKCLFIHPQEESLDEEICSPCDVKTINIVVDKFKEETTMFLVFGHGEKVFTRSSKKPDSSECQFAIDTLIEDVGQYERHGTDDWDEVEQSLLKAMYTYPEDISVMPGTLYDSIYQEGGFCDGFSIKNPMYSEC